MMAKNLPPVPDEFQGCSCWAERKSAATLNDRHRWWGGVGSFPPTLSCGSVSINESANRSTVDFNGDSSTNIADAVAMLNWLFGTVSPHALGVDCTPVAGCTEYQYHLSVDRQREGNVKTFLATAASLFAGAVLGVSLVGVPVGAGTPPTATRAGDANA